MAADDQKLSAQGMRHRTVDTGAEVIDLAAMQAELEQLRG
jgi:hypothetical protein